MCRVIVCSYSALDLLIDRLGGPSQVAEMTGRRGRIVRKHPKAKPEYELRQIGCISDQSLNVIEVCVYSSFYLCKMSCYYYIYYYLHSLMMSFCHSLSTHGFCINDLEFLNKCML